MSRIFAGVILGNNRKRRRGEVELDDLDELSKRKLQRIEERQMKDSSDSDDAGFLDIEGEMRQK